MNTAEFLDALSPVTNRLGELAIKHYIGGSVASSTYGAVRATNDVDLATSLRPSDVRSFLRGLDKVYYLSEEAAIEAATLNRSFNLVHLATALKIDVFCPKFTPFQAEAFLRAAPHPLDPSRPEETFMIASAEDVILTKLNWFDLGGRVSELQMRDLTGIVRIQRGLDHAYLRRWAPALGVSDLLDILLR